MTTNQPNSNSPEVELETWNTKWADFALVADTGEELKCHKVVLAKESEFFEAMLSSDCKETNTNKMKVPNFSLETVFTFLEYIYAGLKWNDQVKHRPYMKDFDMGKITPELMKMCHTYQVDGLFQECSYQLSLKVSDNNVVSLWIDAEKCEAKLLKDRAMLHIKRKKKDIANLPGMEEAFKCQVLMKSLVDFMASWHY